MPAARALAVFLWLPLIDVVIDMSAIGLNVLFAVKRNSTAKWVCINAASMIVDSTAIRCSCFLPIREAVQVLQSFFFSFR